MRIYQVVVLAVVLGTLLPVWLHHEVHGVWNVHQMGLAFFLWLNTIIALWEICLWLRIDRIEADYARFVTQYAGRPLDRVIDFFNKKITLGQIVAPTTWSEIWSSYALFDPSYADRKSFGFWIDVGNGFSTSLVSLLYLYGATYEVLPARVLGIVGLLACYQMLYGTVIYFSSFVANGRHRGHTAGNLAIFVGLSNGIWIVFPGWAMWAAYQLIESNTYDVFR
ncbi:MAG: hypothetical protein J0L92_11430 [Deltaproteobacteria bacterium]|nr:hypothetical protein [Deltaproteobacteria bacterium]